MNETYESYQEFEELAGNIKKFIFNNEIVLDKFYSLQEICDPKLNFPVLKNFIDQGIGIGIMAEKRKEFNDADYTPANEFEENGLSQYNGKFPGGIIRIFKYNTNVDKNLVVDSHILIHELQHAYDYYRSKGKFVNSKKFAKYTKRRQNPNAYKENDEENDWNSYVRNEPELSSFFVEAINNTDLYYHIKIEKSFKEIFDIFKENLPWDSFTTKIQKMMVRKFSQYYYKFKEKYEHKKSDPKTIIETWLSKNKIENYTITDEMIINVESNVLLSYTGLTFFPKYIQFGNVSGKFSCGGSGLINLRGCPHTVGGDFDCAHSNLKNLKGGPKIVNGSYVCNYNKLTTLEGCANKIGSYFFCMHNNLTTLEGGPKKVGNSYDCSNNKLTTLKGCPDKVVRYLNCSNNNLSSLDGCPKIINGNFICDKNPTKFTENDVKKRCKVTGVISID